MVTDAETLSSAYTIPQLLAGEVTVHAVTSSPFSVVVATHKGHILNVSTAAARTLQLPTPVNGFFFYVKDATGSAATNFITLARAGSEQIEASAANLDLKDSLGFWLVYTDGTNWFLSRSPLSYLTP